MKKCIAILLVLCMLVLLVACGTVSAASTTSVASTKKTETSKIYAAFISKNSTSAFQQKINSAVEKEFKKLVEDGSIAKYQLFDGANDPNTQINCMTDAINNGANFIILVPQEAAGSDPIVTTCVEKKIPIVVCNNMTNSTKFANAYVGSNDVIAGEMMGKYVIEQVPNGGKWAHMLGTVGNSATTMRGQGLKNTMGASDKWKLVGEYPCDWKADNAVSNATDVITKYGNEIKAIICDNDTMSSAVQNYCNSIGRKDIVCIGVDGVDNALGMIASGTLRSTVLQDGAGQGAGAVALMHDIIDGKITKYTSQTIDFVLINKDNVSKYYAAK